jgi:hypothetical protein
MTGIGYQRKKKKKKVFLATPISVTTWYGRRFRSDNAFLGYSSTVELQLYYFTHSLFSGVLRFLASPHVLCFFSCMYVSIEDIARPMDCSYYL